MTKLNLKGYIEGYYGRLLTWSERARILETLARLEMQAYLYAPKEDPAHRLDWRSDWSAEWWQGFSHFCEHAKNLNIKVLAGIAPGGDFDFTSPTSDLEILTKKAQALLASGGHEGADEIVLLLDDIEPLASERLGSHADEGTAHAKLANSLASAISAPLSVVPRVYADEIEDKGYLASLASTLEDSMGVFFCGSHVVSPQIALEETKAVKAGIIADRIIVWDNLYANDYCPRRLFLGRWQGRSHVDAIMLNPTGMVETDCLLLALMRAGDDEKRWQETLLSHDVPKHFFTIAEFFDLPPDPRQEPEEINFDPSRIPATLEALDTLLWKWQTPLGREWYPFLMGLKSDILYRTGELDQLRIAKVMPPLLARKK